MGITRRIVRQSVSLPTEVARQVRSLAKRRRLSANRVLVELVEEGIATQERKRQGFFELAERFRAATGPQEVERLGNDLGRMVFGGDDFWRPGNLEQLAAEQRVRPIDDLDDILGKGSALWPDDAEFEGFLADIYERRKHDRQPHEQQT
jgi:hypothetical protein